MDVKKQGWVVVWVKEGVGVSGGWRLEGGGWARRVAGSRRRAEWLTAAESREVKHCCAVRRPAKAIAVFVRPALTNTLDVKRPTPLARSPASSQQRPRLRGCVPQAAGAAAGHDGRRRRGRRGGDGGAGRRLPPVRHRHVCAGGWVRSRGRRRGSRRREGREEVGRRGLKRGRSGRGRWGSGLRRWGGAGWGGLGLRRERLGGGRGWVWPLWWVPWRRWGGAVGPASEEPGTPGRLAAAPPAPTAVSPPRN